MGQDRLDKFIKNQVEEHQTSTDPDLLWQKIQAKQNEKKKPKRRFFIFWLLGGAFLLASIALLYTFQFSANENDPHQGTLSANEKTIDSKQSDSKTKKIISDVAPKKNAKEDTKQDVETNNNTITLAADEKAVDKKVREDLANNTTKKQDHSLAMKPNQKIIEASDYVVETSRTESNSHLATAKNIQPNVSTTDTDQLAIPTPNHQQVFKNEANIEHGNLNTINANEFDTKRVELEVTERSADMLENSIDPSLAIVKSELLPITSRMNLLLGPALMDETLLAMMKEKRPKLEDKNVEEAKKQEKNWRFSNGAAFTYGKGFRTLSSKDSAPRNYVEIRDSMETTLDAFRVNLDFVMQYKNGLYLKSGLEYGQINERFNAYIEWDSTEVEPDQLVAIYYNIDGVASDRKGEGEVTTKYWIRKKKFNRYRSIDIPIIVGYQSKRAEDKRLGWFIEGGASVNIWFKPSGEIFSSTDQVLDLKENADLFKTRTGISLLGAAGLSYKVANKFSLWASPELKYNLQSITSDKNTLDQEYLNVGLRLGIRYHW